MIKELSFLDELKHHRASLPKQQAVLKRWQQAAGVNKMWADFQKVARRYGRPALEAAEFIEFVLSATWRVEKVIEADKQAKLEFRKLKSELIKAVESADYPADLRLLLPLFDQRISDLDKSSYDFNSVPVSRKNQRGSRDRKAFSGRVTKYLKERCGEYRDEDVALLSDLVFPGTTASKDTVQLSRRRGRSKP